MMLAAATLACAAIVMPGEAGAAVATAVGDGGDELERELSRVTLFLKLLL